MGEKKERKSNKEIKSEDKKKKWVIIRDWIKKKEKRKSLSLNCWVSTKLAWDKDEMKWLILMAYQPRLGLF